MIKQDGIVTIYYEKDRRKLNIDDQVKASVRNRVVSIALESLPMESDETFIVQLRIIVGLKRF